MLPDSTNRSRVKFFDQTLIKDFSNSLIDKRNEPKRGTNIRLLVLNFSSDCTQIFTLFINELLANLFLTITSAILNILIFIFSSLGLIHKER